MSDLVVQNLCLFLYNERNEWFSCATLVFILLYWEKWVIWLCNTCVYSFILRGMSDLIVQHLCLFLYTERNEWFSCAILVFILLYWEEWVILLCNTCLYSFILRGMSDLVVQHLCLFLYTERNEWFRCATLVFIPLYWEEWVI